VAIRDFSQLDLPLRVGRYTLTRTLGRGGMAQVLAGEMAGELDFRRDVAVKFVLSGDEGRVDVLARQLAQEARLGGLLNHPGLCQVFDCGVHEGLPYIAMELVDGLTLDQLVRRAGPLPAGQALDAVAQAARALHHAHTAVRDGAPLELVHRDLKPSNLMVRSDGLVKVMDFGVARAMLPDRVETHTGQMKGTPVYMAPEQLEAGAVDRRTDLFALGTVLWGLLTGRMLFGGGSLPSVVYRIMNVEEILKAERRLQQADELCPGVGGVLARLLASDPDGRTDSAAELAAALEALKPAQDACPPLADAVSEAMELPESPDWLPAATDGPIWTGGGGRPDPLADTLDSPLGFDPAGPTRSRSSTVGSPPSAPRPLPLWAVSGLLGVVVIALLLVVMGRDDPAPPPDGEAAATGVVSAAAPLRLTPPGPMTATGIDPLALPPPADVAAAADEADNLLLPARAWLPPEARQGGTLRVAEGATEDPNALLGHEALGFTMTAWTQVDLFGAAAEDPTRFEARLAYRMVQQPDGLGFVLSLRDDVSWHPLPGGGAARPVTAADVTFALDLATFDAGVAPSRFFGALDGLEAWTATDEHTLELRFSEVTPRSLAALGAVFPVARFLYGFGPDGQKLSVAEAFAGFAEHPQGRALLGCGPYAVVGHTEGVRLLLERAEGWPLGGNAFDAIRIDLLDDPAAYGRRLAAGELDYAEVDPASYRRDVLEAPIDSPFRNGDLREGSFPDHTWFLIGWNHDRPWFDDVRVRRALAHAYPAQRMIDEQLAGMGDRITGPMALGSDYYDPEVPPVAFDLLEAGRLLDEAGWLAGDDGIRARGGLRLDFGLLVLSGRDDLRAVVEAYAASLHSVGVRLRIHRVGIDEMRRRVFGREFDALTIGLGESAEPNLARWWHSRYADGDAMSNIFAFRDREVDALLDRLQAEPDRARRLELGRQAHRLLAERQPGLFLFSSRSQAFWSPRLRNVTWSRTPPYADVRAWYFGE
jgi:ABC-type transport system substrate-binding protein/serine/threonine protein kinase